MKNYKLFIYIFLFITTLLGQSLTIPLNMKKAYEKKTRSYDGKPGENYWVNKADYEIDVELFTKTGIVKGFEKIKYHNNSPDTLEYIIIKLYQDILKKGNARDFEIDPSDIHDGVKISNLLIDNQKYESDTTEYSILREGTRLGVKLKELIIPGQVIELSLNFEFRLPRISNIRYGTYDSTSYFVAYWYPQIAVYDDIDGWDMNDYTGYTETYNDINNYKVSIKVPEGFLVWGTGLLQNPEKVLSDKILSKYKKAIDSDSIVNIVNEEDYKYDITQIGDLTYIYFAENVPDFAFAVSNHYLWDGVSYTTNDNKKRKIFIDAAYIKNSKDFYDVTRISKESIKYFSEELPGYPYPYPAMTIFNGEGGMEYPMMVNDGSFEDIASTVHITSHEILHTYFPFYMGINERKYAWMDEGWAVMLPYKIQEKLAPDYFPQLRNNFGYTYFAGKEIDLPLMVLSTQMKGNSYRIAAYSRSAAAYSVLQDLFGEEKFKQALLQYINTWKGKHPIPYDFFFLFENYYGEKLDWFWKPWFFEFAYPDMKIESKKKNKTDYEITIKNIGNLPLPILINCYYEDGRSEILKKDSAIVWKNKNQIVYKIKSEKKIIKFELGDENIPDVNIEDNYSEINI